MIISPIRSSMEMLTTMALSLAVQAGFYALCLSTLG